MTTRALPALGIAACLSLAACSSSGSPVTTRTTPPSTTVAAGATVAAAGSTAATPAGRGSTVPVPRTGSAPDACRLVTEQDATTALGTDPGKGSPFSSHGSTQCQYGSYQTAFLLVNITPTNGRAGYDLIRSHRKPGSAVTVADVPGVGDRAFQVSARNTAGIFFTKGDAVVAVSVTIQRATTPPLARAVGLAKIAAARL